MARWKSGTQSNPWNHDERPRMPSISEEEHEEKFVQAFGKRYRVFGYGFVRAKDGTEAKELATKLFGCQPDTKIEEWF
jgi:hypothetical protein